MNHLEIAKLDLLYVGIILVAGMIGGVLAKKIKIPDIVLFLVIGLFLGPLTPLIAGLFGVTLAPVLAVAADSTMNQLILTIGAAYLLFDGGASLRFAVLKEVWITIVVISTLGVVITGAITAGFSLLLGIPLMTALLLGAVTASTDPATLVPIFKQVPIKPRVAQTVMSESAFNDAMGAIATFTVLAIIMATTGSAGIEGHGAKAEEITVASSLARLGWQAGIGILLGAVLGFLTNVFMAHKTFGIFKDNMPFAIILGVILAFLAADAIGASGFMSVFVFGIMIGNKESFGFKLSHNEHNYLDDYVGTTSLLMRMFIFILLGSQVNFAVLAQSWWQGLILLGVFMFIARPAAVFTCALPDHRAKWSFKEMLFMSWTRETGVIPAALIGMIVGQKVAGSDVVASITFIFILGTILIQAPTTAPLAKKLGLLVENKS